VFTAPQKQEIVERLTEAVIELGGGGNHRMVWCIVQEVASGQWGVGGQTLTSDDVKALARGYALPSDAKTGNRGDHQAQNH
jgi:4-oxalocrotonate tautomerase